MKKKTLLLLPYRSPRPCVHDSEKNKFKEKTTQQQQQQQRQEKKENDAGGRTWGTESYRRSHGGERVSENEVDAE